MRRKICLALFTVLTFTTLAGCAGTPEAAAETTGEKSQSGEITVYTALEDEQVTEYLAAFNEEYPDIQVNVVTKTSHT